MIHDEVRELVSLCKSSLGCGHYPDRKDWFCDLCAGQTLGAGRFVELIKKLDTALNETCPCGANGEGHRFECRDCGTA